MCRRGSRAGCDFRHNLPKRTPLFFMQAIRHELKTDAGLYDIFSGIPDNIGAMKFMKVFHNPDVCLKYLKSIRWPNGTISCPNCSCQKIYSLKDGFHHKDRFKCSNKNCYSLFTPKFNTIFHGSKAKLDQWFYLLFSYASVNKNFSSRNIAKQIELTQKTSWSMMDKIRRLFKDPIEKKLCGVVEIDEAFLSKRQKLGVQRWNGVSPRKEPILGMLERGGRLIIVTIDNRSMNELEEVILNHVEPESIVCTDDWRGYLDLNKYYHHFSVNHSERRWTDGDCHTNNIEMVWGYFKKGIRGNLHYISDKHCQLYCDEFCWRYNRRTWSSMEKFNDLLRRACNA